MTKRQKKIEVQRDLKKVIRNRITPKLMEMIEHLIDDPRTPEDWIKMNDKIFTNFVYREFIKNEYNQNRNL